MHTVDSLLLEGPCYKARFPSETSCSFSLFVLKLSIDFSTPQSVVAGEKENENIIPISFSILFFFLDQNHPWSPLMKTRVQAEPNIK